MNKYRKILGETTWNIEMYINCCFVYLNGLKYYYIVKNLKLNVSSAFSLYSILLNDFIKNIKLIMLLQQ